LSARIVALHLSHASRAPLTNVGTAEALLDRGLDGDRHAKPGNRRSIALVEGLDFRREGKARGFLKIGNRWRDHERWALLKEEWRLR